MFQHPAPRLLLWSFSLGLLACNSIITGTGNPDLLPAPTPDLSFSGPYADLPTMPVAAGGITAAQVGAIAAAFQATAGASAGGPCLTEPSLGALVPSNFSPLYYEWTPPAGQNVFEIRISSNNEVNPMLVYTDQQNYTLPAGLWPILTSHNLDRDLTVTVRGGQWQNGALSAVSTGSSGAVHLAPVAAQGAIVYWTTSNGSALKGFHIGDPMVQTVLTPDAISQQGTATSCVGCHFSAPDGNLVFFARAQPSFNIDIRTVDGLDRAPTGITSNALQNLMRTDQTLPTLSAGHYTLADAVVVTSGNMSGKFELVWTDLRAQTGGTGVLSRTGDGRAAATPAWNHAGDTIAYTSSDAVVDGRVDQGVGEIWTIPYNNRQGGAATSLAGANNSSVNSYYPTYSPNDTLLAFNRIPRGQQMYNAAPAEIYVMSNPGGQAMRLAGNDPPACSGLVSPGQTNSWPRWGPDASSYGGRRYYWLVFSSRRRPGALPQLYLSGVVTKVGANQAEVIDATYPALYITTQPASEANHTPAWDSFNIPLG